LCRAISFNRQDHTLLADPLSAIRLGISERTVKAHLGSVYQKLGVESRSAAVAAAMSRKLV
jgi:NarL family two-component system response regulator YdfI